MLFLAIDTSGRQGGIALARAGEQSGSDIEVMQVVPLIGGTFSAQLVPQIATLLSAHGENKRNLDAFAVVSGPGSFTGLRVGLAAVKALAEVLQKPIAAVSMLEVIAFASGKRGQILTVLDAGRGDVYLGKYNIPAGGKVDREQILSRAEFLALGEGTKLITSDAALAKAPLDARIAVECLTISAADVARLGWQKIKCGDVVTPAELEANYIRRTDAEIIPRPGS